MGTGSVQGTFQESGSNGSSYTYHTTATLGAGGWSQSGWQSDHSSLQPELSKLPPAAAPFNIPSPSGGGAGGGGFAFSGTTSESSGQSS